MEDLMGRMQMVDSSNQYNPYMVGQPIMDQPCVVDQYGRCASRIPDRVGLPEQYVFNPPPEQSEYMQSEDDPDVRAKGLKGKRHPKYMPSVGTGSSDISRGQMFLPSAGDMPIVRKVVMFDTRFRDPAATPTATQVQFTLETPIYSVSRIAVLAARVPIYLTPTNPSLQAEDYAMLSIGMNLPDVVAAKNQPEADPTTASTFSRTIAYINLQPMYTGSAFAGFDADATPPHRYYTDFLKPIPSLEKINLSWWRFQKSSSTPATPAPTPYIIPNTHVGTVGNVNENAFVTLVFFCKNRRPE